MRILHGYGIIQLPPVLGNRIVKVRIAELPYPIVGHADSQDALRQ